VEQGPIGTVFANTAHPYTQALLAARLDLETPIGKRLPEIDPQAFTVQ
jgi:ABC-type dipeptide/oligopeptide/nickel transport system ATPase component